MINEFWRFWIKLATVSRIRTKIDVPNFLETYIAANGCFDARFLATTKSGEPSFRALTVTIVKLGLRILKKEYEIYKTQNRDVYRLNYNFDPVEHPLALNKIFRFYFYEVFWGKAWIWDDVVRIAFDRSIFQENFKLENKISICPYCDLTTIPSRRSAWVEHFLPKNKFPYVSSNPNNLIPTCTPCNVSGTGKGDGCKNPVTNPYIRQIGDDLEFRIVGSKIEIQLNLNGEVENYITLLKSRERYRERNVQRALFATLTATYNLIIEGNNAGELDQKFQEYIKTIGRDQGHYFSRKTLVQDIAIIAGL